MNGLQMLINIVTDILFLEMKMAKNIRPEATVQVYGNFSIL